MKSYWNILFLLKEAYSDCIQPICREHDLNGMEFSILLLLTDGEGVDTAQKIVDRYHLSKSHVSTSLNKLESKGLVTRMKEEGKRKNIKLRVEEQGLQVAQKGKTALGQLEQELERGFTPEQAAIFETGLELLRGNLQQYIQG